MQYTKVQTFRMEQGAKGRERRAERKKLRTTVKYAPSSHFTWQAENYKAETNTCIA